MKSPFSGFWWIVAMLIISVAFIVYVTIADGRFDHWYLLVPGIIVVIGIIQIVSKKR